MERDKIVFVDFGLGKRNGPRFSRPGQRATVALFVSLLLGQILLVSVVLPSAIGTSFFAPVVVAVAVGGTMAFHRLLKKPRSTASDPYDQDGGRRGGARDSGRTLH